MEKKYFPESYLRKRQRDQRNLIMMRSSIVVFALVGGSALGAFIFKSYIIPARQQPKASNELAEERSELAMQERLDQAKTAQPIDSTEVSTESNEIPRLSMKDLEDREFASSFPLVQVSLQGSVASADLGDQKDEPMPGEEDAAELTAGDIVDPAAQEKPPALTADSQKPADKAATEKPVVKPEEKKDDKPKAEEKPKPKAEEKPAAEKPKSEGKYNIVVYVGPYDSQESAEGKLGDLSSLGISGSVTKYAGAYHVRVASFSDYDKAVALSDQLSGSGFSAFPVRMSK